MYGVSRSVSKEQIADAKRMSAIEFLRQYRPNELVRCGNGEFQLQSHDSFKINEHSSVWHWKSRGQGGRSALDYLVYVENVPFVKAVRTLAEENPAYLPQAHAEIEAQQKPFVLPPKAADTFRVERYLQGRGISLEVIRYCVAAGILYESLPYHNAVFVGRDEAGTARYAALRGTFPNARTVFKCEAIGSDKRYGFFIPPCGKTTQLAIYEAAPDAMAHMTLECLGSAATHSVVSSMAGSVLSPVTDGAPDKWRLSLGGIYAPLPDAQGQAKPMKPPVALEQFLQNHPEITGIEICFDNDAT
ncbi:MAG: DUF3991 domain-containing protein, partial [Ruthenibacterium sp.]